MFLQWLTVNSLVPLDTQIVASFAKINYKGFTNFI